MRQKTWKKRLALALAASMTLNMGVITSLAEWRNEGSDWYFYKQDGTQVKDEVRQIFEKWYSFDEDGVMETDKLIDVDGSTFYITSGGEFAVNKWMFLDEEGHECKHTGDCECNWYYFGNITEKDGRLTGGMARGELKRIFEKWYSFDEDGVMETNKLVEADGAVFYVTPDGELAVNKWIFLDEEGHKCTHTENHECKWYYFGNIEKKQGSPFTGGMVKDKLKQINGTWYSFDPETGVMRSDELVREASKERPWEIFYAHEDGHLATQEWVLLTAEGHKTKDENSDAFWYYFKNVSKERGMARDGEAMVRDNWYAFDEDGHMIMRDWRVSDDGKNEYYYQYRGDRAVNKSLYIENEWYRFDETGVATTSNAARKRVETIKPVETEVNTEVGKEVTLKFRLTEPAEDKASTSNAMRNFTNDHDVWIGSKIEGKFLADKTSISADGVCTITYRSDKENTKGDELLLVIDDVDASEAVIVYTTLPKDDEGNEITDDELTIKNIIATGKFEPGEEKEAVEQLTTIYNEKFDGEKKAAFEDQWVNNPDQFKTLEDAYKESQRIEIKDPEVAAEVKGELDGRVSVAGAAFNAPAGSTVELKVNAPEEGWEDQLSGEFSKRAAFDISLLFDGRAQSKLNMPVVITVPVPKTFKGIGSDELKANLKLYNIHNGNVLEVKMAPPKNGRVSFITNCFSTYVFVLNSNPDDPTPDKPTPDDPTPDKPTSDDPTPDKPTPDNPTPDDPTPTPGSNTGSSGGRRSSGGSRSAVNTKTGTLAGQWMMDEIGWWFRLDDGSYAVNSWQYVDYNGTARWYRFDANGYICKGWFTDDDGHRYYLNPVSDGLMGAMLTGWQQIDGIWYYFNTVSDGTQGALLVNTTTPDGYNVDVNGQWIQ